MAIVLTGTSEVADPRIKRFGNEQDPTRKDQDPIRIMNFLNFDIQIRSGSASVQLHFVHFNEYFDKHQQ